ncbi:hypothetical protein BCR42DRAFT_75513 [Absidia repens]|uniref:Uncharacterized protein n=1 Tax=Absidia repens TaxID=90262 RepID=A0A1X2IA94_9FUNG|nr:hypothetical protein BCR42DRAFT_75513 [Absidia repens]
MLVIATYFVSLLFFYVLALPLKKDQQTVLEQTSAVLEYESTILPSSTIPLPKVISHTLSTGLTDYYENIVDQVMETTIDDIITAAPHAYDLLYPGYDCQVSTCSFISTLRDHLNLMRANLIASVHPLFDSNLPVLLSKLTLSNNDDDFTGTADTMTNQVMELLIVLNQRLSIQLGLIINANDAARIIIHQSVPHHSSKRQFSRTRRRRSSSKQFSWHAHENLSWNSDGVNNYKDRANKALTEWLHLWLSDIENILYTQFDDRIEDVIRNAIADE